MKKLYPSVILSLVFVFLSFSCAAGPSALETHITPGDPLSEVPAIIAPEPGSGFSAVHASPNVTVQPTLVSVGMPENITPENLPLERQPAVPQYILGDGIIAPEEMAAFLLNVNPEADMHFVENLALYYVEEAALEGVNHDVAFAQMCLETGYLRFGNLVTPDQNNFAGLGATGPGRPGLSFPDPRVGVRAQIQHLKAYATDMPLNQELVNPRYFLVRRGSAPTIKGLAGTWAVDRLYADKINNILERLYFFSSAD